MLAAGRRPEACLVPRRAFHMVAAADTFLHPVAFTAAVFATRAPPSGPLGGFAFVPAPTRQASALVLEPQAVAIPGFSFLPVDWPLPLARPCLLAVRGSPVARAIIYQRAIRLPWGSLSRCCSPDPSENGSGRGGGCTCTCRPASRRIDAP